METNRVYNVEISDNKVTNTGYITGVEVKLQPYQVGLWLDFIRTRDKVFSTEDNHGTTLVGVGCDRSRAIAIYKVCGDFFAFISDAIWYNSKQFRSELLSDDLVPAEENSELNVSSSKWKLVGDSSPDKDQPEYTTWGLSLDDAIHFAGACQHCVEREVSPLCENLAEALEFVPPEVRIWWEEDAAEADRAPIYEREYVLSNKDSFSVPNLMEAVIKAYMTFQSTKMFHGAWDLWAKASTYRKPKAERPKAARRSPSAE